MIILESEYLPKEMPVNKIFNSVDETISLFITKLSRKE